MPRLYASKDLVKSFRADTFDEYASDKMMRGGMIDDYINEKQNALQPPQDPTQITSVEQASQDYSVPDNQTVAPQGPTLGPPTNPAREALGQSQSAYNTQEGYDIGSVSFDKTAPIVPQMQSAFEKGVKANIPTDIRQAQEAGQEQGGVPEQGGLPPTALMRVGPFTVQSPFPFDFQPAKQTPPTQETQHEILEGTADPATIGGRETARMAQSQGALLPGAANTGPGFNPVEAGEELSHLPKTTIWQDIGNLFEPASRIRARNAARAGQSTVRAAAAGGGDLAKGADAADFLRGGTTSEDLIKSRVEGKPDPHTVPQNPNAYDFGGAEYPMDNEATVVDIMPEKDFRDQARTRVSDDEPAYTNPYVHADIADPRLRIPPKDHIEVSKVLRYVDKGKQDRAQVLNDVASNINKSLHNGGTVRLFDYEDRVGPVRENLLKRGYTEVSPYELVNPAFDGDPAEYTVTLQAPKEELARRVGEPGTHAGGLDRAEAAAAEYHRRTPAGYDENGVYRTVSDEEARAAKDELVNFRKRDYLNPEKPTIDAKTIADELERQQGLTKDVPLSDWGQNHWLSPDGRMIGRTEEHGQPMLDAVLAVDPTYRGDITDLAYKNGFVRVLSNDDGTVNIQMQTRNLTPEQLRAIQEVVQRNGGPNVRLHFSIGDHYVENYRPNDPSIKKGSTLYDFLDAVRVINADKGFSAAPETVGGALGAGYEALSQGPEGETPEERQRRIALGGARGVGVGFASRAGPKVVRGLNEAFGVRRELGITPQGPGAKGESEALTRARAEFDALYRGMAERPTRQDWEDFLKSEHPNVLTESKMVPKFIPPTRAAQSKAMAAAGEIPTPKEAPPAPKPRTPTAEEVAKFQDDKRKLAEDWATGVIDEEEFTRASKQLRADYDAGRTAPQAAQATAEDFLNGKVTSEELASSVVPRKTEEAAPPVPEAAAPEAARPRTQRELGLREQELRAQLGRGEITSEEYDQAVTGIRHEMSNLTIRAEPARPNVPISGWDDAITELSRDFPYDAITQGADRAKAEGKTPEQFLKDFPSKYSSFGGDQTAASPSAAVPSAPGGGATPPGGRPPPAPPGGTPPSGAGGGPPTPPTPGPNWRVPGGPPTTPLPPNPAGPAPIIYQTQKPTPASLTPKGASKMDKVAAVVAENMLSGPRTLTTNLMGGGGMTINRPLTNLASGRPKDAAADVAAMWKNKGLAWSNAINAFATGERRTSQMGMASKLDIHEDAFKGKGGMIIIPFLRAIGATDEFIRTINYKGAEAVGRRRGLRGRQLKSFALKGAGESVYEEDPSFIAKSIISWRGKINDVSPKGKAAGIISHVVFPFVRIPDVIIRKGIGMTTEPVTGPLKMTYRGGAAGVKALKGDKAGAIAELKKGQDELGKWIVATSAMGIYANMSMQGNMTGEGPSDPDERRTLEGATDEYGNFIWRPHSIRVVNPADPTDVKWFDYTNLGHFAVPMAVVANAVENYYDHGQVMDGKLAAKTTSDIVKTVANASYLQTMGQIVKLAFEGRADQIPGRLTGDLASRVIPKSGLAREAVGQTDPEIKEPRKFDPSDPLNPRPWVEGAKAQIPGLSREIPGKVGPFGQPESRGKDIWSAFLPITGKGDIDPVRTEVAQLNQRLGDQAKVGLQYFTASDLKRRYDAEQTPEQTRGYQIEAGQLARIYVNHLITDPRYDKLSDKDKAATLNKALSTAYQLANLRQGDKVARDEVHQAALAFASIPHYEGVEGTPQQIRMQNFEIGKAKAKLREYNQRYGTDTGADMLEADDNRSYVLATEYPRIESEILDADEAAIDRRFNNALSKAKNASLPGSGTTTYSDTLRDTLSVGAPQPAMGN